jgi:hypothetical protein
MKKRWLVLAGAIGLSSAVAVWQWPPTPLWHRAGGGDVPAPTQRTRPEALCEVLRFGRDDRSLYAAEGLTGTGAYPHARRLCRWDAVTGELLGTVSISYKPNSLRVQMRLSPDARTVLLGEPEMRGNVIYPSWIWLLFDAQSGQRRGKPIVDVHPSTPGAFSRGSRWFWVNRGNVSKLFDGIDIIETATGKAVVELRDRDDGDPHDCCFAPDGSAAAVHFIHWGKGPKAVNRSSVRIIELPSGREIRRFDLPMRSWHRLNEWAGDRLYAEVNVPNGPPGCYLRQSYSFDLTAKSIGEGTPEPLLNGQVDGQKGETYWDNGPGWVAHLSSGPREVKKWEEWLEWLAPKVAMKFRVKRGLDNSVRFFDAGTGRLRYELPSTVTLPCVISSDGKRVACVQADGMIEVWDADPRPRWPWVLAAGMIGAGPILIFGRWRRRRRSLASTLSSSM